MTKRKGTPMTVLDNGIALERTGDGVLRGRTVPEWANMVGPFGGITAAALVRAIELQPDVHGLPVALTANYLAPIVDGPFDITARAVRTNRTNQHWYVELSQDGEVKTTATAVFGIRRDTWGDTELVRPSAPAPEDVPAGGPGPTWMNNYDMRYVAGGIPTEADGESASSETLLWLRDNPARPWDFAALAAACDVFYPRVFRRHHLVHRVLPCRHRHPGRPGIGPRAGAGTGPAVLGRPLRPVRPTLGDRRRVAGHQSPDRLLQGMSARGE
jgi:acyl-CoA thioesterase